MKSFFRFSVMFMLAFFLCIVLAHNAYAEEFDSTVLRNDSQFLTIFLHGLSGDSSDDKMVETNFYGATSYFSDTLKERTELGQTYYHLRPLIPARKITVRN